MLSYEDTNHQIKVTMERDEESFIADMQTDPCIV